MRIFFIGGTGNISSDCASLLAQRGHEVVVLSRGHSPVPLGCRAVMGDRKDVNSIRRALEGYKPEVVINFLGYEVSDVALDVSLFDGKVRQYIFISSTSAYAKPPPRLPITEDTPLANPLWDYAQKKQACEEWLLARWRETGFPVTIIRPSHTYSKRWVPNAVSSSSFTFAQRLEQGRPVLVHDDGESPWTMTASRDFAVGLAGLVGNARAIGQAFHITSDEVLTWNQIYADIARAVGAPSPEIIKIPTAFICEMAPRFTGTLKGDKAHPGVFDNTEVKRLVPDFSCRVPFHEGIQESVAWLRAHPEQQNLSKDLDADINAVIQAWRDR